MAEVRKAYASDFPQVLPLLRSMDGPRFDVDRWRQLFGAHGSTREDHCGYVLVDGSDIVGFLGMIFSERQMGTTKVKLCNLTSWVVHERFRAESLKLLMPLRQMNDYVVTNFTANRTVSQLSLSLFRFRELEKHWVVIPPVPTWSLVKALGRCRIITDVTEIERMIAGPDLEILADHRDVGCHHLVIESLDAYCYVVYHRARKKRIRVAHIDYISNAKVFGDAIGVARLAIAFGSRALAVVVDERLLRGWRPALSFRYAMPKPSPRIYRPARDIDPALIDTLYSELVLLGM